MINTGELDRIIIVERNTPTANELNEQVNAWATFATRRASRRDVSDAERAAAGSVGAYLISRFVIHADSVTRSITPKDRLSHEGGIWNITGIKETKGGSLTFLEITATRDADA